MTEFDPAWLIYFGAALLLMAYAIREELKLRIMIVVSTFVYIAYYYLVTSPPLWDAIFTSLLMVAVNLWVLAQIVLERTRLRLSDDEKQLFDAFETLTPGQFRRVLKLTKWHKATDPEGTVLTREDEPSGELFYIMEGAISVQKSDRQFRLPSGNFVGEVAYILRRRTTATTVAPLGVRFVKWDSDSLRQLGEKHPNLGNALNALLTRDLAKKLTSSYRPDDAMPATEQTKELLEAAG